MDIKLVGSPEKCEELHKNTLNALDALGLTESVSLDVIQDDTYAQELGIKEDPALCIEEASIDFKDMIFEGVVPEVEELRSMFISIFGGEACGVDGAGCGPDGCSTCPSAGGCSL